MNKKKVSSALAVVVGFSLSPQNSHAVVLTHPVALQNATATASQALFEASETIDGNLRLVSNGWATLGQAATIVWETTLDQGDPNSIETRYNFRLYQDVDGIADHFLQNFRLSYTTDDRSLFADGVDASGDVTATWVVIDSYSSLTTDFTAISLSEDPTTGDILATKADTFPVNAFTETSGFYDLETSINRTGITGFRLEALNSPGLAANGNFVLRELQVSSNFQAVPEPSAALLGICGLCGFALKRRR